MPIVHKTEHAAARRRHQQVRVSVAIHVGKDRAATELIGADDPGLFGHILESPAAEILVEGIPSVQTAQIDIRQPIAIVVSHCHAGTVEEDSIGFAGLLIQSIGDVDSGLLRTQPGEPCLPPGRHMQLGPSHSNSLVPPRSRGRAALNFKGTEQAHTKK